MFLYTASEGEDVATDSKSGVGKNTTLCETSNFSSSSAITGNSSSPSYHLSKMTSDYSHIKTEADSAVVATTVSSTGNYCHRRVRVIC